MKWALILGAFEASAASLKAHKGLAAGLAVGLALAVLALLGVYLPQAHYRASPIAAGFLLSFFAGVASCKVLDRPGS